MMRNTLLAAIGAATLGIAPAVAADLAARPYTKAPPPVAALIYDWSGFYIGLDGGGGSSRKCWDINNFTARGTVPGGFREGCHDATGGIVGGQIGYRWQAANWVFGVEAQGDWADLKGSNVSAFVPAWVNNSKIDAIGLFTGQVGYAWNSVLWYVKGGAAVTHDKFQGTLTATGVPFDNANDDTRWGGTIGAGLEWGFAPNWSVGVEYDHLFMGNRNLSFTSTGALGFAPAGSRFRIDNIHQDVDMGTVRINYRFGGPVVARY
jgi:outer membrane immunogenic protein